MSYSQCLVSRNGPLGAIWVAAYFFKKLKKAQVKDTHIPSSIDQILEKELDALTHRVLAYLLLGVVRIYSKKVDFLFDDCNKVLIGVKEFVAKEKNRENSIVPSPASTECWSIALPLRFELDAFDLGVLEDCHGENVKAQEDITLKDGVQETESMDLYSTERFDMEEDLLSTFHETFFAGHDDTRNESFAHDMDVDAENVRDTTEEASVRVLEAEPLDSNELSRGPKNASKDREDRGPDDMLVEPQMSEDIRSAQDEDMVRQIICTILEGQVDPHESLADNLHKDRHMENSESEAETRCEKMHGGSLLSECGNSEATHGIEEQPSSAKVIDAEKEIPEMSTPEKPEPGSVEEQPSDAKRFDVEKEIPEMSMLEKPEPGSVSETGDLPEGIEKYRGHSDGEMSNSKMVHGSHKETPEASEVNLQVGLHNGFEKGFICDMTFSEEGVNATETPVAVTPKASSQLRISEGETSPQFLIIPTPAAKESSRLSRKRKCLIDDEVIIPNKVMKKMIEDSSNLISKRRQDPHTAYPEKRTKRFADPAQSFLEPLIPYGSLDLELLFSQPIKLKKPNTRETPKAAKTARRMKNGDVSSSEQTENACEIMETRQAAALAQLKVTVPETVGNHAEVSAEAEASSIAAGIAHQTEIAPETPVKPVEPIAIAPETPARSSEQIEMAPETPVVSEQVEIAPDTPVRESMSMRYFKDPETCDNETRPSSSFTCFDERPSMFSKDRDLDTILMNEEVNADEREDLQRQERWSARTRNVAKFLEKAFVEQREKEEEERVNLSQLCRGRTQKESARLFYETLVLKTKGYLEVKQDHPYSDILLTRFSKRQEAC